MRKDWGFEGASQVEWFQGNYEDYEADHRRRIGHAALAAIQGTRSDLGEIPEFLRRRPNAVRRDLAARFGLDGAYFGG